MQSDVCATETRQINGLTGCTNRLTAQGHSDSYRVQSVCMVHAHCGSAKYALQVFLLHHADCFPHLLFVGHVFRCCMCAFGDVNVSNLNLKPKTLQVHKHKLKVLTLPLCKHNRGKHQGASRAHTYRSLLYTRLVHPGKLAKPYCTIRSRISEHQHPFHPQCHSPRIIKL